MQGAQSGHTAAGSLKCLGVGPPISASLELVSWGPGPEGGEALEDAVQGKQAVRGGSHCLMLPRVWHWGAWGAEMSGGAWRLRQVKGLDRPGLGLGSSTHELSDWARH